MKHLLSSIILSVTLVLSWSASAAPLLWVGDSAGRLGTVDVATGDVNVIGNMGVVMTDIAFDSSGNLWGISFDNLYSIDKNSGSITNIGAHNIVGGSKNSLVLIL